MSKNKSSHGDIDEGWIRYGLWTRDLRSFMHQIINTRLEETFLSLNNNEERVKHFLNNELFDKKINQMVDEMISNDEDVDKNLSKAIEMREMGNHLFKEKSYHESIEFYSKAICLAPHDVNSNDNELSLAFANRSAAHFRLNELHSCILDIDDAMKYSYPTQLTPKIMLRKAQCFCRLGKYEQGKQVLNEINVFLESNRIKCNAIKRELEELLLSVNNNVVAMKQTQTESNDNNDRNTTDLKLENCNEVMPHASDQVLLNSSQAKGRFITAAKEIQFGDVLFKEQAYAHYIRYDQFDYYCQHCVKQLNGRSVPCRSCAQVRYCCETCRNSSWTDYHQYECKGLLNLLKQIGISYIVIRIILKTGIKNAVLINKQLNNNKTPADNKKYESDYTSILSLLNHENEHQQDVMLFYTLTALFLLYALKRQSLIDDKDENFTDLGVLMLKHMQQLSTNLISILKQNMGDELNQSKFGLDAKEFIVGTGLYPTISLLNHSCDPTVITFFEGSLLTIRAAKSLRPGDEVNYCYGPNYQGMSFKDRQNKLKEQYFFTCNCFVCSSGKENIHRALSCTHCHGPLIYNEDYSCQCINCKRSDMDVVSMLNDFDEGMKLASSGARLLDDENYYEALVELHKADQFLSSTLYCYNNNLCKIKDDLCRCYALMGHFDKAAKYCQQSIKITKGIFGGESVEVLTEVIKFISLKWEMIDEESDSNQRKLMANELLQDITQVDNIMSKFKLTNGFETAFKAELEFLNEKRLAVLSLS